MDQRYVTVGLKIPLTEHIAQKKIVRCAEAADSDFFALEIFPPFDLGLDHDLLPRFVIGPGEHHQIGAGEIGLNHRGDGDLRDRDILGEHCLDNTRAARDIN